MPFEPGKKIEELLRAYAAQRREESGEPLALHPANRRLLQDEVTRTFGRSRKSNRSLFQILGLMWPRLVFAASLLVVMSFVLWRLSAPKPAEQQLARKTTEPRSFSSVPAKPGNAGNYTNADEAKGGSSLAPLSTVATALTQELANNLADRNPAKSTQVDRLMKDLTAAASARPESVQAKSATRNIQSVQIPKPHLSGVAAEPRADEMAPVAESSTPAAHAPVAEPPLETKLQERRFARVYPPGGQPVTRSNPEPSQFAVGGETADSTQMLSLTRQSQALNLSRGLRSAVAGNESNKNLRGGTVPPPTIASPARPADSFTKAAPASTPAVVSSESDAQPPPFLVAQAPSTAPAASPLEPERLEPAQPTKRFGTSEGLLKSSNTAPYFFRFQQVAQPARSRSAPEPTAVSGMLDNFNLEITGDRLRIIDADGSVYLGRFNEQTTQAAGETARAAGATGQIRKAEATKNKPFLGRIQAAEGHAFEAQGTNRNLNQVVTIRGYLFADGPGTLSSAFQFRKPEQLGLGAGIAAPTGMVNNGESLIQQAQVNTNLHVHPVRVVGQAVIGPDKEIKINAVRVSP